jgi:hypothetical protein
MSDQLQTDERREKLEERRRQTLQWLAAEHFNEQRSLQATDEKLFNWAVTVFLTGFGALSGLRTASDVSWGWNWRLVLWVGIVIVIIGILMVAYRVRRNYEQNQRELANIVSQLVQLPDEVALVPPLWETSRSEDRTGFYLRWAAVAALGVVFIVLIGMMG